MRRCSVPSEGLREELADAQWELGLEVHGLLVGVEDASDGLSSICTHVHKVAGAGVGGR
eukprot:COSAG01_NODE_17372_length_1156_cov_5.012299_2_plen_59_part_00